MGIRPIGNSTPPISPVSTVRPMTESAAASAYGNAGRVTSAPEPAAGTGKLISSQSERILSQDEQRFFERMFAADATAAPASPGYLPRGQRAVRGIGTVIDRRG